MKTPFFLAFALLAATAQATEINQILYNLQRDKQKGYELYDAHYNETGHHNLELLHQMGLMILSEGYSNPDPEIQLLTIFGAGVSSNEKALYILEEGIRSTHPNVQLIAMNFLCSHQNTRSIEALNKALTSNYLQIRLEAVYHLAVMREPSAVGQTEALMQKVPKELYPIFPQIFAMVGNRDATKILQKFLVDSDIRVRIEAIRNIAKFQRDDLLPQIRILASHRNAIQQEACANALGALKDESSIPQLKELAQSPSTSVSLAALKSLYNLEQLDARTEIENYAKEGNPFAINILGSIPESKSLLRKLLQSKNLGVKVNAAIALLEQKDPSCVPIISDILIKDTRDLVCTRTESQGHSLYAWKVVPSARQNLKDDPVAFELSLNIRESLLHQSVNLPEKDFLSIANLIFESNQNDLVPTLVRLLENYQTSSAIELLKKYREKPGAPLIRNYCNLALFRLKEPGPYVDSLREWVASWQSENLIQLRPYLPWELRDNDDMTYQINAHEASRLLVEAFEAFADKRDDKGIEVLLNAIRFGNSKNKYALAGLLMRTSQ